MAGALARRHLRRWGWLDLTVANGEAIPLRDESQDAATSIFMMHELPPKVRRSSSKLLCIFRFVCRSISRKESLEKAVQTDKSPALCDPNIPYSISCMGFTAQG